ncbi:MAG: hypothetical protein BJ554DRAFT_1625 [Olpidium bornovanus]|uniref:Uncharacterized protein n=1 Tax=Olpidium bornovanus TaxID=278681 RepID=A0A8H8DGY1_9FUNG|nr:MAG: hypothetical protein BJ554DRAFT_1625 [Olpidium bornovanus]
MPSSYAMRSSARRRRSSQTAPRTLLPSTRTASLQPVHRRYVFRHHCLHQPREARDGLPRHGVRRRIEERHLRRSAFTAFIGQWGPRQRRVAVPRPARNW